MGLFSKKNEELKIELVEEEELFPEELEGIKRSYYFDDVKVTRFCEDDRPIFAEAGGFIVDEDVAVVAMIENESTKQMVADYVERGDLVKVAFTGPETIAIGFYRK